jgi:hypothetical protein
MWHHQIRVYCCGFERDTRAGSEKLGLRLAPSYLPQPRECILQYFVFEVQPHNPGRFQVT